MSSIRRRAAASASSKELPGTNSGNDTRTHSTPQQQQRCVPPTPQSIRLTAVALSSPIGTGYTPTPDACCLLLLRRRPQVVLVSTTCLLAVAAAAAVLWCYSITQPSSWPYTTAQQQQQQQQGLLADLGYSGSSSWAVSQVASTTAPDGTTYGPSLGIFPHGCKWRDVSHPNSSDISYEYWVPTAPAAAAEGAGDSQGAAGVWSNQQPAACRLQASAAPGELGVETAGRGR